jgi:peroxiredoxin
VLTRPVWSQLSLATAEEWWSFMASNNAHHLAQGAAMKFKHLFTLIALAVALLGQTALGADAQEDIKAVVTKIQTKLKAGQDTEAQLAPELKELDAVVAKLKESAPEDAAQAAFLKGVLYGQIFKNNSKAAELIAQVQKDFPNTKTGKKVPEVLANIKKMEEVEKLQANLNPGNKFPDFAEKDLNGKPLSVAAYKGKVVLIDFWATWCGPCVAELPNVKKTYEKYHKDGFEIIGISLDEDKAELTSFMKKNGMTWVQFFDGKGWENKLAQAYGVQSIPATFLLDGEGKIIGKSLRGDDLETAVAKALKK